MTKQEHIEEIRVNCKRVQKGERQWRLRNARFAVVKQR